MLPVSPRALALSRIDPEYAAGLHAMLDVAPGHTVLELGVRRRPDGGARATLTSGSGGCVDLELVAPPRPTPGGLPGSGPVAVSKRDRTARTAHLLAVEDNSVDRLRADFVMQDCDDVSDFFDEVHRVLRPGGLACVSEPDWGTLIIDPCDAGISSAFNRFLCATAVRHPCLGRQLPRQAEQRRFAVRTLRTAAPVLRDLATAEETLGLTRLAQYAVETGRLERRQVDQWFAAMRAGPFLATGVLFTIFIQPLAV